MQSINFLGKYPSDKRPLVKYTYYHALWLKVFLENHPDTTYFTLQSINDLISNIKNGSWDFCWPLKKGKKYCLRSDDDHYYFDYTIVEGLNQQIIRITFKKNISGVGFSKTDLETEPVVYNKLRILGTDLNIKNINSFYPLTEPDLEFLKIVSGLDLPSYLKKLNIFAFSYKTAATELEEAELLHKCYRTKKENDQEPYLYYSCTMTTSNMDMIYGKDCYFLELLLEGDFESGFNLNLLFHQRQTQKGAFGTSYLDLSNFREYFAKEWSDFYIIIDRLREHGIQIIDKENIFTSYTA